MNAIYNFLKSQKLGIIVGFTVTGLLIIGSFIMSYFPRHYAGLSGDDITFFFSEWKPIHAWFYLLFIGCVFYGVNTFLCTLDSVIRKAKGGVKKISLYGASLVHVGFIITLVVHLVGGLCSTSSPPVSVANEWVDVGGTEMKVTDLKTSSYPNGMPKNITVFVSVRKDGVEYSDTLGYNNPVLLQHGVLEVLMRDYGWIASSVILNIDGHPSNVYINEKINTGNAQLYVADLYMPPQYQYPVVKLVVTVKGQGAQQIFLPVGEKNAKVVNGVNIVFEDIKSVPGTLVSVKRNPSIPLTFVAIFFFSAGVLLVIFRTVRKVR